MLGLLFVPPRGGLSSNCRWNQRDIGRGLIHSLFPPRVKNQHFFARMQGANRVPHRQPCKLVVLAVSSCGLA